MSFWLVGQVRLDIARTGFDWSAFFIFKIFDSSSPGDIGNRDRLSADSDELINLAQDSAQVEILRKYGLSAVTRHASIDTLFSPIFRPYQLKPQS